MYSFSHITDKKQQCICIIGACGAGKTTLALLMMLMNSSSVGTVDLSSELPHYTSESIFLPGRVFGDVAKLGVDSVKDTVQYLHNWRNLVPTPRVFIIDGSSLASVSTLDQLLTDGVRIMLVDLSAPTAEQQARYQYRRRGNSYLSIPIETRHERIRTWAAHNRGVVRLIRKENSTFTSLITFSQDLLKELKLPSSSVPASHFITTEHILDDITYKVYDNYLPTTQLQWIRVYTKNCLYLQEIGQVRTGLMAKPRGIRVEGLPGCGISYKQMSVPPQPLHPLSVYLLDIAKRISNWDYNCITYHLILPGPAKRVVKGYVVVVVVFIVVNFFFVV